eukprot:TRINITY_DN11826_c0_g1_i1.p1 TRINITY_DN11826_c0_g1~~TRINITY_DN11826_c0_g1_i1.p1  ORF type:complete len:996 (+),score=289.38 TRINITY_DN11826_c0_g1_i1:58-2988(+)
MWENGLKVYLEKEKYGDRNGMNRIIEQLNRELDVPSQISKYDEILPSEFPPPPPAVGKFQGTDQASYTLHMRKKLLREQWEYYLKLYLEKKEDGDKPGMKSILQEISGILKEGTGAIEEDAPEEAIGVLDVPPGFPPPPPVVGKFVGVPITDRDGYKKHMRLKLTRQTWEIAYKQYKANEKSGDTKGLQMIIDRLKLDLEAFEPTQRVIDTDNLPPGFPPPPPKLGELFKCTNEQEYKEYMMSKYLRDNWEDCLILYRKKQEANDTQGMEQILQSLNQNQQKIESHRKSITKKRNQVRWSMSPSAETTQLTQKLYELEALTSPKDLNVDAQFQAKVLILLQELMRPNHTWKPEDQQIFDGIKSHLDGQLRHIFINFTHYCEALNHVDIKTLLKLFETVKGKNNIPSILCDCFQHSARTTFVLHTETASDNHNNSKAVKLAQTIKMVTTTLSDDLEKTSKFFREYVDPVIVSSEVFHTLISKETALLCQTDSDPTEMLMLYKAYIQAVQQFQSYDPKLSPIDSAYFEKWVRRWSEGTLSKLITWMDRAIENDKWDPISSKVTYSVGVLSLKDSLKQNFELIQTINHNHDWNVSLYVEIVCNTINYYLSRLKEVFVSTCDSNTKSNSWGTIKLSPEVIKFFEQTPLMNLTITDPMCTQINNIYGIEMVLKQFEDEIKSQISPESAEKVATSQFIPTWKRAKDFKKMILQHTSDQMKPDVQLCLRYFSTSPSPSSKDPLFTYIDYQLSTLSKKIQRPLFELFLKSMLRTLVEAINGLIDEMGNQSSGLFKKVENTKEIVAKIVELVDAVNEWIFAGGDGLPQKQIDKIGRSTKIRLDFWNLPTKIIIDTYNNTDNSFEIKKADLWSILQSRRNEDVEAKEFISSNGGFVSNILGGGPPSEHPQGPRRGIVSTIFGKTEPAAAPAPATGGEEGTPVLRRGIVSTLFGKSEPDPPPNPQATPLPAQPQGALFSSIFDWFQN